MPRLEDRAHHRLHERARRPPRLDDEPIGHEATVAVGRDRSLVPPSTLQPRPTLLDERTIAELEEPEVMSIERQPTEREQRAN